MRGEQLNLGYLSDSSDPQSRQSGDAEKGDRKVQIQKNLGLFSGISIIIGNDILDYKTYIFSLLTINIQQTAGTKIHRNKLKPDT